MPCAVEVAVDTYVGMFSERDPTLPAQRPLEGQEGS